MRLHHVRRGEGPPLLLLHGIGMSHRVWERVIGRLARHHECFAADLPGFGRSAPLGEPPTMAALARACADFMGAQGHERFHVSGNSLGGGVALHLAIDGVTDSACPISPAGFSEGWEQAFLEASLRATYTLAAEPVRRAVGGAARRSPAVRRAVARQNFEHGDRVPGDVFEDILCDLAAASAFHETRRHALRWKCPDQPAFSGDLTVAWAEHDRLLLTGPQSARARKRLPSARHVILEGCGHVPFWDDPAQVARVVLETTGAFSA